MEGCGPLHRRDLSGRTRSCLPDPPPARTSSLTQLREHGCQMSTVLTKQQERTEVKPPVHSHPDAEPLMGPWVVFSRSTFKQ